jgi:hypothetical protein
MREKNANKPFHFVHYYGVGVSKTFTSMLLIQALVHFYNKHHQSKFSKKESLRHTFLKKLKTNRITIHSNLFILINFKNLRCLNSK